jgi:Fic family protein
MLQVLRKFTDAHDQLPDEVRHHSIHALDLVRDVESSQAPVFLPMKNAASTEGELARQLSALDFNKLHKPMSIAHIHLLHQLTMIGILPVSKCGRFRAAPVYVGNPDLFFPPSSTLPTLMEEFCQTFPMILPNVVKYDPLMQAARVSHRFVRIHPYGDSS